jgi:hypothetical protein
MSHFDDDDPRDYEAWRPYLTVLLGQKATYLLKRMPLIAVGSALLFALYCIISYCRGDTIVDQKLVENSVLHHESLHYRWRYRWQDGLADEQVASTLIDARLNINRSELLIAVASHRNDSVESATLRCREFIASSNIQSFKLMTEADEFIRANIHNGATCVCAPMFGAAVRYMAVGWKRTDIAPEASTALSQDSCDNNGVGIEHLINPVDVYKTQYDDLDAEFFETSRIDLAVELEDQNYRYNCPRGNYSILRRSKIQTASFDASCRANKITFRGGLAFCVQRCIDLLRGIDVRTRAIMQYERGVRLNVQPAASDCRSPVYALAEKSADVVAATSGALRDEL